MDPGKTGKHKNSNISPENWVNNHGDYLYNYAYSRVQSKELAEDLVQDTFIAALKAKDSFKGKSTEITWLISILKRKVIDYYRKSSTKKEISSTEYVSPFQEDGMWKGHWNMDRVPKVWPNEMEDPLMKEEFQHVLELCLSVLPEKWKAVFILKFIEEVDSAEVCKELSCTPSNFWVILYRTRLKLRECIENKWLK